MADIPLLNLTPKAALEILRECAADDRRMFFSPHARQRMVERQITRLQVLRCLEKGSLGEPHRDVRGDWRCTSATTRQGRTSAWPWHSSSMRKRASGL